MTTLFLKIVDCVFLSIVILVAIISIFSANTVFDSTLKNNNNKSLLFIDLKDSYKTENAN